MLRTCLVVDPSHVVRKVARRIFETMQFETSEAETGQEALEKCEAEMPDAILLDGHLPTMSNVEVLANAARAAERTQADRHLLHDRERCERDRACACRRAPTSTSSSRSIAKAFAPS